MKKDLDVGIYLFTNIFIQETTKDFAFPTALIVLMSLIKCTELLKNEKDAASESACPLLLIQARHKSLV